MQASELQHVGSAVAAPGLWSTGSAAAVHALSCSTACGIVPDQGLNPCLLHGQVDSLPLSHQGSPQISDFKSERWTFLAIQWLRLHAPIARGWGLILGQGTRFHMQQLKILSATVPGGLIGKESACNAGDSVQFLGQEVPLEKR